MCFKFWTLWNRSHLRSIFSACIAFFRNPAINIYPSPFRKIEVTPVGPKARIWAAVVDLQRHALLSDVATREIASHDMEHADRRRYLKKCGNATICGGNEKGTEHFFFQDPWIPCQSAGTAFEK